MKKLNKILVIIGFLVGLFLISWALTKVPQINTFLISIWFTVIGFILLLSIAVIDMFNLNEMFFMNKRIIASITPKSILGFLLLLWTSLWIWI